MANAVDKEQIEMLKSYWRDYGRWIVLAAIIGLAIGFGWRYWYKSQQSIAEQASISYQQVQIYATQKNYNAAQALATKIQKEYSRSPYASLAALMIAKDSVKQNKLSDALTQLQWVIDNSVKKSFKQIARVRKARILLQQKKLKAALSTLSVVDDASYQPLIDEVKGDIYFKMGDGARAKKSYLAAQQGYAASQINNPLVEMKLSQ